MHFTIRLTLLVLCFTACGGAFSSALVRAESPDDSYAAAAGFYARGEWRVAIDEFRAFLEKNPEHAQAAPARFYLGEALVMDHQLDDAAAQFRAYLAKEPEGRFAARAEFRAGEADFLLGRYDAARKTLEHFAEKHADDALMGFARPYLGQIALHQNRAADAEKLFRAGLDQKPDADRRDELQLGLGQALEAQQNLPAATEQYRAVVERKVGAMAAEAQYRLGANLFARGEHEKALDAFEAFETTFRTSPYVPFARLGRARVYYEQQKYDDATKFLTALRDDATIGPDARYWLAMTDAGRGKPREAAQALETAVPDNHELASSAALEGGKLLLEAEDWAAADAQFARGLEKWPQAAEAAGYAVGRLESAAHLGDGKKVTEWWERFVRDYPTSPLEPTARLVFAQWQTTHGGYREALALAQKEPPAGVKLTAFQQLSRDYVTALAYQGLGDHERALKLLETVAASDSPLKRGAEQARAASLEATGKSAAAIELLDTSSKQAMPGNQRAQAVAKLALAYARNGDFDHARIELGHLQELNPPADLMRDTQRKLAASAAASRQWEWVIELWTALLRQAQPAEQPLARLALGTAQLSAQKPSEAEATFAAALAGELSSDDRAQALMGRGQALEQLDRADEAMAAYKAAAAAAPNTRISAIAVYLQSQLYLKRGEPTEAATLLNALVADPPPGVETDWLLYTAGFANRKAGAKDRCTELFTRIRNEFRGSPYWADAVYRLTEKALEANDAKQSEELLTELLAADLPTDLMPHVLLLQSQAAVNAERWTDVAPPLEQLLAHDPPPQLVTPAKYWIAESIFRQQDAERALPLFDAIAATDDTANITLVVTAKLRRGEILAMQRKWPEAREVAEQIQRQYPNYERTYAVDCLLGRCLMADAKLDDARTAFRRATDSPFGRKTEEAAMAQFMIGESFFHQKNYRDAVREYMRVEILYAYPKWRADSVYEAAQCFEQLGEVDKARKYYQRVVDEYASQPISAKAKERLAAVSDGTVSRAEGAATRE